MTESLLTLRLGFGEPVFAEQRTIFCGTKGSNTFPGTKDNAYTGLFGLITVVLFASLNIFHGRNN